VTVSVKAHNPDTSAPSFPSECNCANASQKQMRCPRMAGAALVPKPALPLQAAFVRPRALSFSSDVWKRPWPNLDEVSMNLSLTSSNALRDVCGKMDRRNVITRFLDPGTAP
jgi:hypothetical protein